MYDLFLNLKERRNGIIGLFDGLFKKMTPTSVKPKAVAFVDYEHWYISLDKMYNQKPDIKAWYADMASRYHIVDVYFFADFSNQSLRSEIPRIREVTSSIIETQNASSHHKKDYTDFIMLDHIYQKAMTASDIDTYIIFSGDGHFSSVASFLNVRLSKNVGVYAVKDAVSNQLRNCADWLIEIPMIDSEMKLYYQMILRNLKKLYDNAQNGKKLRAAFWPTVEAVSKLNGISRDSIADALRSLIERGYIYQTQDTIKSKTIKVLNVNWDKVTKDGLLD